MSPKLSDLILCNLIALVKFLWTANNLLAHVHLPETHCHIHCGHLHPIFVRLTLWRTDLAPEISRDWSPFWSSDLETVEPFIRNIRHLIQRILVWLTHGLPLAQLWITTRNWLEIWVVWLSESVITGCNPFVLYHGAPGKLLEKRIRSAPFSRCWFWQSLKSSRSTPAAKEPATLERILETLWLSGF